MGEVNITYETLFELLRREKNREELQKLDESFLIDVLMYLKEKKIKLDELKVKNDMFAADEKKKAEIQEENIRKILREFYEKREKKIIAMAVDKSRTSASVVDTSALLNEERAMYEALISLFDNYRRGILFNLLELHEVHVSLEQKQEDPNELQSVSEPQTETKEEPEEPKEITKTVRIIEFIPKFIGADLKEHGPFEDKDTVDLPPDIAELLIDKGGAEEID